MADKRKIGKSGLTVNPVGLGCKGFSHAYGAPHVVIATKFGVAHGSNGLIMDSRPETIRKSVEGSLKRLGVDVIDLYYQHRIDPNIEPETVAEVMNELMEMLILLCAANREVDSIVAQAFVKYPEIIRKHLQIPESEEIIIGIGLGYKADDNINEFRSPRKSLTSILTIKE